MRRAAYRGCLLLGVLWFAAACTTITTTVVPGERFRHVVVQPEIQPLGEVVHLYIGGDGRPFLKPDKVAPDPTATTSVALRLMAKDPAPRMYLGRPCYHGLAERDKCHARWWTSHRYAPAVVDSMATAAKSALAGRDVVLVGFSGGGTLAVLLAERLPKVRGVITVAANLDVTSWTALHGYTPLVVDDVPAILRRLPVRQMHLYGGRDSVIPPELFRDLAAQSDSIRTRFCEVPDFGHTCCWHRDWSDRFAEFRREDCASAEKGRIVESPGSGS